MDDKLRDLVGQMLDIAARCVTAGVCLEAADVLLDAHSALVKVLSKE